MYTVYCDGFLLYDPRVDELEIINPKLNLEVNKSGAFDFLIYPTHPMYNHIHKLKSVIEVFQDGVLIYRGRPLDDDLDYYNAKNVTCEGELGYFNDSLLRPYEFEGSVIDYLKLLIDSHNSQVDEYKKFEVGNVTVTDPNDYITRSDSTYPSTWKTIEDKLIKLLGGYIVIRRSGDTNYIDYLVDSNYRSDQEIKFAENLLDIAQTRKGQDIKTAIIPIGADIVDEDGNETGVKLDITSVNDGVDFVFNQEAVDRYGWIFEKVEFDDVTVASNLKRKGEEYLANAILTDIAIDLTAIDLSMSDVSIDELRVFEYVKINSAPHNLQDFFLITKLAIDLINPDNNTVTVGAEIKTFTEKSVQDKNDLTSIRSDYVTNKKLQVVKNDVKKVATEIEQNEEQIILAVSENYTTKNEFNTYSSYVDTRFVQTKNTFDFQFSNLESVVSNLDAETQTQFNEIIKYIRFENGNIILGQVGNELILTISNNRISFLQSGVEVAYLSNNKLFITDAEVLSSIRIGNYAFFPRSNGNLSFKWVG